MCVWGMASMLPLREWSYGVYCAGLEYVSIGFWIQNSSRSYLRAVLKLGVVVEFKYDAFTVATQDHV